MRCVGMWLPMLARRIADFLVDERIVSETSRLDFELDEPNGKFKISARGYRAEAQSGTRFCFYLFDAKVYNRILSERALMLVPPALGKLPGILLVVDRYFSDNETEVLRAQVGTAAQSFIATARGVMRRVKWCASCHSLKGDVVEGACLVCSFAGALCQDPEDCSICLQKMIPVNGALTTTRCRHTFHSGCISAVDKCPLCRASLWESEIGEAIGL